MHPQAAQAPAVRWSSCTITVMAIRVCMRIFTTALRSKTIRQILNENNSPYFHSVSLVIWPFTLMKRTQFSELSISRFSTYIRKAQGWTLHFQTPDPRSEKSQRKMTWRPQIQRRIQYCSFISIHYKINLPLASDWAAVCFKNFQFIGF